MNKKRTGLIAIAIMLIFSLAIPLAGCQPNNASQTSDDLSIWIRKSDYRSYIKTAFELYENESGNKLNVKVIEDDNFADDVAKAFAQGDAPDILMHYNDTELAQLGIEDNFLVLNDQAWADSLMSGSRAYCDDGKGNLIGLPFWESSISGCYYNKRLLSKLGLKPASTQTEFDMLCQAIANVGYTPLLWGDKCGWMYQFGLDPIFADNPSLLDRLNSGEIDYADIPQVHDMVQWIYDANQKGWLGDTTDKGLSNLSVPLATGQAVMVDIWDTWFETDFESGEYTSKDFAIMPIFMGTSDSGTYEGGNLNMMMVNKNAKNLDEAIGFLEFCAKPEIYNEAFKGVPSAKVFKDQNTIVTPDMVINASDSIEKLERVSTANPKIIGYSQDDMMEACSAMLKGELDVDGCIAKMDELRKAAAQKNN